MRWTSTEDRSRQSKAQLRSQSAMTRRRDKPDSIISTHTDSFLYTVRVACHQRLLYVGPLYLIHVFRLSRLSIVMVLDEIRETRALITLPHSPKGWQGFICQLLRYHIRSKGSWNPV
jgi:hypothetical protein